MPNCIILRGLPGSGKSTIANLLRGFQPCKSAIVSADEYFMSVDGYKFDKSKLGEAHEFCFSNFKNACLINLNIIVDNTNLSFKEYSKYIQWAKPQGYSIQIITIETDLSDEELAKRNIHGVPVETIKRMRARMNSNG